jgi:hypothetical protein
MAHSAVAALSCRQRPWGRHVIPRSVSLELWSYEAVAACHDINKLYSQINFAFIICFCIILLASDIFNYIASILLLLRVDHPLAMSLSSSSTINILLLNPNSSVAMTKIMESAANAITAFNPVMP